MDSIYFYLAATITVIVVQYVCEVVYVGYCGTVFVQEKEKNFMPSKGKAF